MPELPVQAWLTQCLALFGSTFAHEDVGIIAAAFFVTQAGLPTWLALASLTGGMVASELLLYGLGAGARRVPLLRRLFISPRVERARQHLGAHLGFSIGLSRLVPGLLFPTCVACGWFGLSFARVAVATALASASYAPFGLWIAVTLVDVALPRVGHWAWVIGTVGVVLLAVLGMLRPASGILSRILVRPHLPHAPHRRSRRSHRGMPPLDGMPRTVSAAERIPPLLFYAPLFFQWLALGWHYRSLTLPTVADPLLEAGGLWGESKSRLMSQIDPEHRRWVAAFATVRRSGAGGDVAADVDLALEGMARGGLEFPVVAKPDIGWQGYGVRLVSSAEALREYVSSFPPGETIILQRQVPYDGEAGVLYARIPGELQGSIVSLAFRYFPHVVGDGSATLRELIAGDSRANFKAHLHLGANRHHKGIDARDLESVPGPGQVVRLAFIGSLRVGGLYRDARQYITPALTARFDAIARSMPEFYFGRFDIRFGSTDRLQAGEDFEIIQVNGAGAEAIHVWDPELPLRRAYGELFRFQSLLFQIGDANRHRGYRPMPLGRFVRSTVEYHRLLLRYPPSG